MPALSVAVLILLLLVASNEGATGRGVCTEGFMGLSLLVAKAATPVGSLADNTLAEGNEGRWIIDGDHAFNCTTAAVTEVLLGVDIRSNHGNRSKYPSIEMWLVVTNLLYEKIQTIPIALTPDNFTTNGLYHYILPTPYPTVSLANTYRLGISTETVGRIRAGSISESSITITGLNREIDQVDTNDVFMAHLITEPPNCFQNVFTETEINTNSLSVTNVIPVTDTRAFPDIQFTCNGIITNWIIGITQNQDTSKHYPNIYLKRSSQLIHALTVDASAATSSNGNVYNFTSDIEVQYGDILVINVTTNSNPMYYQQYNGPLNYELDSSNGLIPLEHNDYPLISVMMKPIPSITQTSSATIESTFSSTTDIVMMPHGIPTSYHSTGLHHSLSTTASATNALSSSVITTSWAVTTSISVSFYGSVTSSFSDTSSSINALYSRSTVVTKEPMESTKFSITSTTTSMESTPGQMSVLVCRRKQLSTGNAKSNTQRVVDEHKRDEGQNIISNMSGNAAYGVIGGNKNDDDYSNPAYGINTMTQSINEEPLVYDKAKTMNNKQGVIVIPAHNEAYTQQKEEEEFNEGATGGGVCTEGFMDLSLLVAKAATPVGSLADNTLAENNEGRWIIAGGHSFNCSGTVTATEVLLGIDIRSKNVNRNKYPSIEIWRIIQYDSKSYYWERVSTPITLSPDNVTTNGLYRYVLPTPFSVSSNYDKYRLGVFQPEDDSSVVRLYNATTSSTETVGRIRAGSIGDEYIRIYGSRREIDLIDTKNVFMVHLITNPPNCFKNVFTEAEINTNSLSVTNVIPVNDTRAFPDIQFTCNGIITNWIIGITQNQDTSKHYPNIYLKRSSELIHALTVDASAATSSNGNVYNFTSDIEVEYGDILVINVTTNSNPMYYQQYNGPLNYELDSSNGLIPLEHNDYPLISVITSE
uniref:IgGFc-binding protein N-terminal domain-containing protein n=1 Tax=Amphimedon queenslandica TaxID=400682 RepID=A0A1X7TK02_AMPQE